MPTKKEQREKGLQEAGRLAAERAKEQTRSEFLALRISAQEKKKIEEQAKQDGLPVAEYIRQRLQGLPGVSSRLDSLEKAVSQIQEKIGQ